MDVVLVNSAMMPREGKYIYAEVSREVFVYFVRKFADKLQSYIGYPDTAAHITEITGVDIPLNREPVVLRGDTIMLICKLAYRVQNPDEKGKFKPNEADYVYGIAHYQMI